MDTIPPNVARSHSGDVRYGVGEIKNRGDRGKLCTGGSVTDAIAGMFLQNKSMNSCTEVFQQINTCCAAMWTTCCDKLPSQLVTYRRFVMWYLHAQSTLWPYCPSCFSRLCPWPSIFNCRAKAHTACILSWNTRPVTVAYFRLNAHLYSLYVPHTSMWPLRWHGC